MHPLLRRQMKRYLDGQEPAPEMCRLLDAIDQTYQQNDLDRELLERSLELSSAELNDRYQVLETQLELNKAAKHDLERTLSMLDATFDATKEGIVVIDPSGKIVRFNEVFAAVWEMPETVLRGRDDRAALDFALSKVVDPEAFLDKVQQINADPQAESFDVLELRDGRILERYTSPQIMQGVCVGRVWSFRDITERKSAETRLILARRIFEASNQGILITGPDLIIVDVNRALCDMLALGREQLVGRRLPELEEDGQGCSFNDNFVAKLTADGSWWGELRSHSRTPAQVIWINFSTVYTDHGETANYVGMFTDVTKLKEVEDQLQQLAYYDPLTGLPNRRLFKEHIETRIAGSRSSEHELALLYLDLDRFKFVNDSLGHLAGDQLLKRVAERISSEIRAQDVVSRQGGDEFTIALIELEDQKTIGEVATRIIKSLSKPFRIKSQDIYIGASIGICVLPDQAPNFEEAVRKADMAMYLAKSAGKGRYCFWDTDTQAAMEERMTIESDLREALREQQLVVYYQPVVDTQSRRPIALEALLRWEHPRQGLIAPGTFIPIAEETGMISEVENRVIDSVCRQLREWADAGLPTLPVSINVSAQHLSDALLRQRILDALQTHQIPPSLLSIEITETTAMREPQETVVVLRELKALGIQSAIDDFGTGYSSLSYLKQLPADTLKIDRSFIRDIINDPNDRDIAKAIVDLGHSLSMRITAEGVENERQLAILKAMGCDQLQGWLFAEALPATEIEWLLKAIDDRPDLPSLEQASP